MARTIGSLFFALGVAGCACGGPGDTGTGPGDDDDIGECSDVDLDGYGAGTGCDGSDCDDSNPDVWDEAQCDALCDEDPHATGCECSLADNPEPEICYSGPAETLGTGDCRAGLRTCQDGEWSPCEGQVLPSDEICDSTDNNCDGQVDEGVLSDCGDCSSDCEEDCVGIGCDDPFDPENEGSSGIVMTPEGGLTLDGETGVRNYVIWIANSSEGTVSKINTRTREEEGRYRTGPGGGWGDSPSRTTVNYNGDVVVANRGAIGEATRYDASDCEDADGDGDVETSTGVGDVYAWQDDECWRWTTAVGGGARGSGFEIRLGLDGVVEEYVWVGSSNTSIIKEIAAEDGELTGREIPGVNPYGLAMGPDNMLWTFNGWAAGGSGLAGVSTLDDDLEKVVHPFPAGVGQYGITCDSQGRVWVTGSATIGRYNSVDDEWESIVGAGMSGGIAVDGDDNAWTGEHASMGWGGGAGPWTIDGETLEVTEITAAVGGHGWAVDFDGFVWSVPFVGNLAYVLDPDNLDDEDGRVEGLVGAYTYSDMTGFQLINATNPLGIYMHVFDSGCGADVETHWAELEWEAIIPAGTSLRVAVRTADTLAALAVATTIEVAVVPPDESPVDLTQAFEDAGITPGALLHTEWTLQSLNREDNPILNSISASHSCEVIIG